jgi:hypothetical protein
LRIAEATRSAVWPWETKLGARPIGQWLVIHPSAPTASAASPDHDEVIGLTRYASIDHRAAMAAERAVELGGDGPDWQAWSAALRTLEDLTISMHSESMQGHLHHSPPIYLPALPEHYRLAR